MQLWNAVRVALALAAVAIVAAGKSFGAAGDEPVLSQVADILPSEIDAYVRDQMAADRIPGAAVVVVQEDHVVYEKGFGTTSLSDPSPVTPQTLFDLASCSKSFTALAVLIMEDEGLVDLDVPVVRYLPDFQVADPEVADDITVRHLLNQTSGLPGKFAEPLVFYSGSDAMRKVVASMAKVHLNRAPGASFEYSDLNYALLGALIERVSGTSFEDYLQRQVFEPLGMAYTTLDPNEASRMERARGHQLAFGRVVTRDVPVYRSAAPAGWVISSGTDMGRWLLLHLAEGRLSGRQVVPPDLIRAMHTPGVTFVQNGDEVGYGMGWFTGTSIGGLSVLWHGGDTSNFATDMMLVPEHALGVAVLVNSQVSSRAHDIAPGVASLVLHQGLELPEAPWWASWEAADAMASVTAGLSVALLLLLVVYVLRRWRSFRRSAGSEDTPGPGRRTLRVWRVVLPLTPLALLTAAVVTAGVVVWLLFGVNVFRTLVRFGAFAPPGVWISGWLLFGTISIWALALAGQVVVTAIRRRATRRTG